MPWKVDLKLSHKGFILVALPLLFELIFVVILTSLLSQAEDQAKKLARSQAVTSETMLVCKLMYDGCNELTGYSRTHNRAWAYRYDAFCQKVPEHMSKLRALTHGNFTETEIVDRFATDVGLQFQLLQKVKDLIESGDQMGVIALASSFQGTNTVTTRLTKELEEITNLEEHSNVTPESEAESRRLIRVWLAVGVVLNILVAVALAIYFNRGTAIRLNALIENTRKLARRESLNPRLAGRDEIAEMDSVFHDMADALTEAARRRQEYVSMVSHDLRSPLTALQGTLKILMKGTYGELNDHGRMRIGNAENSILRLIKLVNDILDIEKLETGKMDLHCADIAILPVIEKAIDSIRALADEKHVSLSVKSTDAHVLADEARLVQVVVNLLTNAVKFSPADSNVVIEVESKEMWVETRITDTGKGIPAKYREAIFDRFTQVDSTDLRGSGLGLAICKLIIEQHGGSIGVISEEGRGSTFWFRLKGT